MQNSINLEIENIYKTVSGRVLASLVRILGDYNQAEEALQEAFAMALEKWPTEGIPQNPRPWLVSAGKFKAIDVMRREQRGKELLSEHFPRDNAFQPELSIEDEHIIDDDQLRLIFYCCHPALPLDSRIALSLRDFCGMKTEEIATAYFVSAETIKKRISRAKLLFREKNIAYQIPLKTKLSIRLNAVLHVIYLIFNEGYSASAGENRLRRELTDEALFLCRRLVEIMPQTECLGLLALLLLQEARRDTRVNEKGEIVALENQDRATWDRTKLEEGVQLLQQAFLSGRVGPYTLQAAIASVHASADSVQNTRWDLIVGYYDMLLQINPSPVVELNRAIAIGMRDGAKHGLAKIDALIATGDLKNYHLIYAAKADFLKKLGEKDEAKRAYEKALELVKQEPEKCFLERQLAEISG